MFGVIKKLFWKSDSPPPAAAPVAQEPSRAAGHTSTWSRAARPASAAAPAATLTGETINLPLNQILSQLPDGLRQLVLKRPGGIFSFSVHIVWEQLRTGAVRIPFAELRQSSPGGTFADDTSHDDSLIDLPLALIVAALGPGALARRPDQKRVEVPDEVKGVFVPKSGVPARAGLAAARPAAPVAPRPAPSVGKPVAPAAAPVPPPLVHEPVIPAGFRPAAPKVTTFIRPAPVAPKPPAPTRLPFATARPAPPPAAPAAAPAPGGERVVTTLEALCGAWPEAVRQEIQQFNLESAGISIPLSRLEAGLKAGRVVFSWAEVCGWLSEPMPPSANGQCEVELPLKVIAPLFLAKHRAAPPRKIVTAGEDMPNLFAGPVRPVAAPPAPAPQAPRAAPGVLDEIVGQPAQTEWTPKEIIQRILALPGVGGGVLASGDGLLVAGWTPAPVNAETLAAFLPQFFARLGGLAQEAQLGTLRALTLAADPAPCAIFKAGALYLGVLGRADQPLPEAALEQIACELAKVNH
jgi:predicted regulator of Ras-like GTPase activity (Roadblock/LC7/MglB family)